MNSRFAVLLILVVMACVTKRPENEDKILDSSSTQITSQAKSKQQEKVSLEESKRLLQGIWAVDEDSNALFEIKGDSLYYFEDPEPVFYKIEEDSLKILIEGRFFSSRIIGLTKDSLIRIEYNEVVRLYNRR